MPSINPFNTAMGENEATSTSCSNNNITNTRTTRVVLLRDAHIARSAGDGQEVRDKEQEEVRADETFDDDVLEEVEAECNTPACDEAAHSKKNFGKADYRLSKVEIDDKGLVRTAWMLMRPRDRSKKLVSLKVGVRS